MASVAKGTLRMSNWVEEGYQDGEGIKLTKASSEATFTGDTEGQGGCQWLLAYPAEGPVTFVGLQSFTGKISGHSGACVLRMTGTFRDSTAYVTWSVVPGSGGGELAGLSGEGGYEAPLGQPDVEITLDYHLES